MKPKLIDKKAVITGLVYAGNGVRSCFEPLQKSRTELFREIVATCSR